MFFNILERLHSKNPSESYVDNIGNNQGHVSVNKIREKKVDDGEFHFQQISTEEL